MKSRKILGTVTTGVMAFSMGVSVFGGTADSGITINLDDYQDRVIAASNNEDQNIKVSNINIYEIAENEVVSRDVNIAIDANEEINISDFKLYEPVDIERNITNIEDREIKSVPTSYRISVDAQSKSSLPLTLEITMTKSGYTYEGTLRRGSQTYSNGYYSATYTGYVYR